MTTAKIQFRQGLSSAWTSTNPVLSSGEVGLEEDTGSFKVGDGVTAWTSLTYTYLAQYVSFTPTLAQGVSTNISKTVNYSKYKREGASVVAQTRVTASAAGTAGSAITLSVPVSAAASAVGNVIGSGYYNDGGTQYQAIVYLASASTVALLSTHGTASTSTDDAIGINPNIAVASTDVINVDYSYEAA